MCCQELTFADETSCRRGRLFLTDERIFEGPMLPIASCLNVSFKIDGECGPQLQIMLIPEGSAVPAVAGLITQCSFLWISQ